MMKAWNILELMRFIYYQFNLVDILNLQMKRTLVVLAVVALACSLHLQSLEHALQNMNFEHQLELPLAHAPYDDQTLLQIRNQYLAALPQGPTVDGGKAKDLQNFFGTPMGSTILNYFNNLTVQPDGSKGLNRYKLSDANFRLWMGIKILAGDDVNTYARSLASDKALFAEFIEKSQKK